jgi:RNA polymerase sigma-70 factor (ECF subfamily)
MTDDASIADLVSRARRGDRAAFGALIRRFERTALAVAFAATGDEHAAGDVTQEAFLRAWRRLDALKDDAKFAGWLCCIVRNSAADLRRKVRPDRAPAMPDDDRSVDPVEALDRQETSDRIAAALGALDELSRTVVVLRYYEGLSSSAIADLLTTSRSAVDMRLSRARAMLKRLLIREDGIVR